MYSYTRTITETIEAVQITDSTFDANHPNPEHVVGVTYDPLRREVIVPIDSYGDTYTAVPGDWIVRFPGEEHLTVLHDDSFRGMGWERPASPETESAETKEGGSCS